jgi:hypothetical protein
MNGINNFCKQQWFEKVAKMPRIAKAFVTTNRLANKHNLNTNSNSLTQQLPKRPVIPVSLFQTLPLKKTIKSIRRLHVGGASRKN